MKKIKSLISIFIALSAMIVCSLFFSSALSAQTFDPDRLNAFYDTFVSQQEVIVQKALNVPMSGPTPPPGMLGYAPLVITNNTGLASSRLYIIGKGQTLAATDSYFLQPNLSTGVCTLVSSTTNNSADPTISVQLSQLPSAGTNSYFIYVPQMISGRFYISVDRPLYMETLTVSGVNKINDPSQTSVQDPNYYTLYQDFEFTLDVHYDLYANVTNVDYFSLATTLGSYTSPSGAFYPTLDNLTIVGYPLTLGRTSILSSIQTGLTNDASSPAQWVNLTVPFYSDPYVGGTPLTDLRILAAKQSISLGLNGVQFVGAGTPQAFFNATYLESTTSGPSASTSYMTQLYNYYNTGGHSLQFTIFPNGQPQATYTLTAGGSLILQMTSSSPSAVSPITVNLNNLTTKSLFDGAIGEWVAENAITPTNTDPWQTEIAKLLSALYNAGMLPPATSVVQPIVSSAPYFSTYRGSYFSNPTGFTMHGPWYNLYDQTIHPLLIQTDGFGLGYAYDFDDLLDIAGLLHVNIQTAGVLNPYQPYVVLSAGPIDTPIPNPTVAFGPYTLNVGILGSGSQPINIIYSTSPSSPPSITVAVDGTPLNLTNVYNYFQVQYSIDGTFLTYDVYPKYQLVLPTTTRYNAEDVTLMNGIVFLTGTNDTTCNINVPNTQNVHN